MTYNKFRHILYDSKFPSLRHGGVFLGLQLLRKYLPDADIEGANDDIIYSVDVEPLLEAGITEEDVEELARLRWRIKDGEYLAHFV